MKQVNPNAELVYHLQRQKLPTITKQPQGMALCKPDRSLVQEA